jgi:hypothetical protein
MATPFKQTMDGLRAELLDLVKRRNEIETRIVQVSNAIEGLVGVLEDPAEQAQYLDEMRGLTARVGFSSAVRSALALRPNSTPLQVRDSISENRWMDLAAYSNPLASIHTTLRRMKEAGEVEENDGKFRLKIDRSHPIHKLSQRPVNVSPGGSRNIRNWMALRELTGKKT